MARLTGLLLLATVPGCARSAPQLRLDDPRSPLHLVRKIALPNVRGRVDHLALDPEGKHLFVAEYGNGSVDEVDLASGRALGRISGLSEPQGVAWLPKSQEVAVACGDGSVHFYRGIDRKEVVRLQLSDDADNERVDARSGNLVVGFGSGALAVIDPPTHRLVRKLDLRAHPEAFELVGSRAFANVPHAHAIVIGDLDQAKTIRSIDTANMSANYPMAADAGQPRIAVAFRSPSAVSVLNANTGETIFSVPGCSDADDLYFRSGSLIEVCGQGAVQLISLASDHHIVRVGTRHGARTGLLAPSLDRLFVAVPADGSAGAEIWELSFN